MLQQQQITKTLICLQTYVKREKETGYYEIYTKINNSNETKQKLTKTTKNCDDNVDETTNEW